VDTPVRAIRCYEKKIEKKRNIKNGLMQRLLSGKRRLPGYEGEWKEVRLGALLDTMRNGCVYESSTSEGVPVTRIETISDGVIDYSRTGYAKLTSELENYRLERGDILYSHINSIDHIGKVALYVGDKALYHGMNLLLLRANISTDDRFLFYSLTSSESRKKAQRLAKKAISQASINTSELKKMDLALPLLPEQQAIASVLSEADTEINMLRCKLAVLKDQKRFLLNNLVTGAIRLPQFVDAGRTAHASGDGE